MANKKILLIDDDPVVCSLASGILRKKGYEVLIAKEGQEGLSLARDNEPDMVIVDYQMPGMSGIDVLNRLKEFAPEVPVVILTAYGDASLTIQSIQIGAFDFIEKPINPKELLEIVKNGLDTAASSEKYKDANTGVDRMRDENLLIGKSRSMRNIFKQIGRISQNNVNVLISGEVGTGKERLARLIHLSGKSKHEPLVYLNAATLEDDFLSDTIANESDKGTNRQQNVIHAKLNEAGQGSIMIDEVDKLTSDMQVRLLNYLNQYGYDIDGSNKQQTRVISITSNDISALVRQELFSQELYYKLSVFSLHLPPLRERKDDIEPLVSHLLQEINPMVDHHVTRIEDGVLPLLKSYEWPGNVRELKNVLMQSSVLSQGEMLEKKYIKIDGHAEQKETQEPDDQPPVPLAEVEKEHIDKVLRYTNWNKQDAAALLGITRPTLNAKIEKYGLNRY